jgi:putative phosphoesterase
MRVLMIADVHANWEALFALQHAEPRPDAVLFAGDAVGYGPDPANCVKWLLANATLAVRGNHDDAVYWNKKEGMYLGAPPELEQAARDTLAYSQRCLPGPELNAIGNWPLWDSVHLGGARFYSVHGTPSNPLWGRLDAAMSPEARMHELFDGVEADVVVLGHSHIPAIREFDHRLVVNPGSLGQPRCGLPDATYAVWEDGQLQIKHLHYDHSATARRLRLTSLSPEVVEQLSAVLDTGLVAA